MTALTYRLWNPIINQERSGCTFDVTPDQEGLASGTKELMSEFLRVLKIEAEPLDWNIEQFCSAYYIDTTEGDNYLYRHGIVWRVKINFTKPYRKYSVLDLKCFEPHAVENIGDKTWREWELGEWWEWTTMKYVAIIDFELWEWTGFLEDFQAQKEPVFAMCQNYEYYLLGSLMYQARFDLGVVKFPEQEEQVMAFLRVCENYNASTNWTKSL